MAACLCDSDDFESDSDYHGARSAVECSLRSWRPAGSMHTAAISKRAIHACVHLAGLTCQMTCGFR
eukprot:3724354-Alexandrium_andersonii.AAC.1